MMMMMEVVVESQGKCIVAYLRMKREVEEVLCNFDEDAWYIVKSRNATISLDIPDLNLLVRKGY